MKLISTFPNNYELIDAGGGKKLERWGEIITIRPEHQAYFQAALPINDWKKQANCRALRSNLIYNNTVIYIYTICQSDLALIK